MKLDLIKYRIVLLSGAGILVAAAAGCILVFGFRLGIDFTGGTMWQLKIPANPSIMDVERTFTDKLQIKDAKISMEQSGQVYFARLGDLKEVDHQKALLVLQSTYAGGTEEMSFQSIGPSVSEELRTGALWAIVMVLVGISLYIAFAFRKVSRPVSSWTYGWVTLVSLFHDVVIPAGLLALLGKLINLEIDTTSVVALLVVMGFSVHDTIVVFDRIRENLFLSRTGGDFGEIINTSVNQTIARSINTSLTLVLVLVSLLVVGPQNLHYFMMTLLVGVVAGTYSSIFVATPLLYLVGGQKGNKR